MANEDPEYLARVRALECRAAGLSPCLGAVEAHHAGRRGLGQRAHDHTAIPLCHGHHMAWHDARGPFASWVRAKRQEWTEEQILAVQALCQSGHSGGVPW